MQYELKEKMTTAFCDANLLTLSIHHNGNVGKGVPLVIMMMKKMMIMNLINRMPNVDQDWRMAVKNGFLKAQLGKD